MGEVPFGWRLWEENRKEILALAEPRRCPCCDGEEGDPYFTSQCGYRYVTCAACGMVYVDPAITSRTWSEVYNSNPGYVTYMRDWTLAPLSRKQETEPAAAERFRFYFDRLREKAGLPSLKGLKYLDIGTYDGDALVVARDAYGMDPHGVEARAEIASLISSQRGLRILGLASDDIESPPFGGDFHVVSAFESLEHSFCPRASLERIFESLADGGLLIMTVPNIDNMEIRYLREFSPHVSGGIIGPGHINLFGGETLCDLLSSVGFEIVDVFSQFASSIPFMLYRSRGLDQYIPCHASIASGKYEDSPPELYDKDLWAPVFNVIHEWEMSQMQGPILGIIANKPGASENRLQGS